MPQLLAFAALAAGLVVVPGPAMAVSLRNGMALGTGRAMWTVVGLASGTLIYGVLAVLGVATLLQGSPHAADVLQLAGGVFIGYLGVRALQSAARGWGGASANTTIEADPARRAIAGRRTAFNHGFLTNLLNPKPALFYLAVFPLFLDGQHALGGLVLVAAHLALIVAWYGACAVASSRMASFLRGRPGIMSAVEAGLGLALVAVAVRLLLG